MAPHTLLVLAQAMGGGSGQILIIVAMFAVMYLLLFRPQQKAMKEHRALIAGLKKGDDVVTQGGIIGKISAVADTEVQLEIASGVKIRVMKTSVQARKPVADAPAAKPDDAATKDAAKKEDK